MNFFESQAKARSASRRLVWLFLLALLAIVATIDLVVVAALHIGHEGPIRWAQASGLIVAVSLATAAVIGLASLYKMLQLRAGGGTVARQLGAMPVPPETTDPRYRRLRNVIEEIAIASGVPVPEIYVLEQEAGINAFAAGYATTDAAITVTRGALEKLTRDELQGVIAHEFSHVLNGDMRLNIRLMGLLFGILFLGTTAARVLRHAPGRSSSSDKGAGAILLIALALVVIGYVGVFFGRMIKAGVSRSREYLADASAVQFTRQTSGIAGALKKISGIAGGSKLSSAGSEDVSHMLFGEGMGFSGLFATHPPLLKRIRKLDPAFKPEQLSASLAQWNDAGYRPWADEEANLTTALAAADSSIRIDTGGLTAQVAHPGADDYLYAEGIRRAMPAPLTQAAHSDLLAPALVLGLLLDGDAQLRERQLQLVAAGAGLARRNDVETLWPALRELHPAQRLPLLAILFPLLHQRPREELIALLGLVQKLTQADAQVSVFEWCLGRLLRMQVSEALQPAAVRQGGRRRLAESSGEVQTLLSVLAHVGHADPAAARRAFLVGLHAVLPQAALTYAPPPDWMRALDTALRGLDALDPTGKSLLLDGIAATLMADGRLNVSEGELLRVVCASLHCPLPPLLDARPA